MCGITGFAGYKNCSKDLLRSILLKMTNTLVHRGPDDCGIWADEKAGVGLGHRRLSIVDLSSEGHQPMISYCGRYVLIYNGEIYNFTEIKRELLLKRHVFRGHSDTEVLLNAVKEWGVEKAVSRCIGMFAFVLWDRKKQTLYLVRDRLGIKPLYYGWLGNVFVFGSELKALKAFPDFKGEIDRDVLSLMLRYKYVPAPYSIYKGIEKLLPGTILGIGFADYSPIVKTTSYWSAKEIAEKGTAEHFSYSLDEGTNHLDTLLREAINMRMIADVPIGALLSGGVDSSTVVALMQAQSSRPVETFTIGFNEQSYNEAAHAKAIANYLGTNHNELYVTPYETMLAIPGLPALYDEPFSDPSQVPTFLISKLARQNVTVSLSGDGGDELFAGYNRHFWGRNIWRKVGWVPRPIKSSLARLIINVSPGTWETMFERMGPLLPGGIRQQNYGNKLHKLAKVLAERSPESMYYNLVSDWMDPSDVVIDSTEPPTLVTDSDSWANLPDYTQRMMFLDMVTYLPDDILTKVDRASMGVSLEVRVPFLDHRVVDFAWRMPLDLKIRNGLGKWLLRQLLYKYIPKELIDRPKAGFGIPIDHWLRGPLRDWAGDLLGETRLRSEGYFRPEPIRKFWEEHLSGRKNRQYYLWNILMFQAWLEKEKHYGPMDNGFSKGLLDGGNEHSKSDQGYAVYT